MKTLDELRELYAAMPVDRLRDAAAEGEASYRPEAWQIIQQEIQRRRDDGRWLPEHKLAPEDVGARVSSRDDDELTGVRGWLAFFVVVMSLNLIVSTFQGARLMAGGEAGYAALLLVWAPVYAYGLQLVLNRDTRAPQYWIVVMVAQAVFSVATVAVTDDVRDSARGLMGSLVWAAYWATSRRVRNTFALSAARTLTVGSEPDGVSANLTSPSAPAAVQAEQPGEAMPSERNVGEPGDVAGDEAKRDVLSGPSSRSALLGVGGAVALMLLLVGAWYVGFSSNREGSVLDGVANIPDSQALTPRAIAGLARAATVQIRALDANGRVIGQGTGFFLSTGGHISTNLHVIRPAHTLQVATLSGDTYDSVFYVTADARGDVAILKIPIDDARPLAMALDTAIAVGEPIYVMGNPLGQTGTFSDGMVSANRTVDGVSLLQMTAPVSPGSSGGPVLNARGEVVAMATLMLHGGQNLSYAVPVRYIRPLLETGEQPRPYAVGLLPRVSGGLSSVGVADRASGPPRPSRDPTASPGHDVVSTHFVAADSSMRSAGAELASRLRRGSLEHGAWSTHEVELAQGRNYAVVGLCDEDCSDLDLAVATPAGVPLVSDVQADDKPNLLFTAPANGTYRLKVTMVKCSVAACGYGVRLYRF